MCAFAVRSSLLLALLITAAQGAENQDIGPKTHTLKAPLQKLTARITPSGLTVHSDENEGGAISLCATWFGRDSGKISLAATGSVQSGNGTASFIRPGLREDYSTSNDGIRQDFVVTSSPEGTGFLQVGLELTGGTASQDPDGVKIMMAQSQRLLAYHRLHVTDGAGKVLPAKLIVQNSASLVVKVDDRDAAYPIRIDPTFSDADWVSLNSGLPGTNGDVTAMTTDSAGNLYIAGTFRFAGQVAAKQIAKWDGSSWSALGVGLDNTVHALAVIGSDLYAGGGFGSIGGLSVNHIAKWNGSSWSALGTGTNNTVQALAVIGTDLYVAGIFTAAGGSTRNRIAKWDGSSWSGLGTGMNSTVNRLAVSGTTLYAAGAFSTAGGNSANQIARWDGSSWSALGTGISGGSSPPVNALVASGSDLFAAGSFTSAGGVSVNRIAKWNGSSWSALGTGVGAPVNALALVGTDLFVGGDFTTAGGSSRKYIAKWNGSTWAALGSGTNNSVKALAAVGEDLYVGGAFTTAGSVNVAKVARWASNSWSAIGPPGINSTVRAIVVNGNGLIIGGDFTSVGTSSIAYLASWDGSSWSSIGGGVNGPVRALLKSGTNLYVGGEFTTAGATTVNYFARWNGSSWVAYGTGMDAPVNAVALFQSDLYVGGEFRFANGVSSKYIARWNPSGSTFFGNFGELPAPVYAMAHSASMLYVGGDFSGVATYTGSQWSTLPYGPGVAVYALAVSGSNVYAGGPFTSTTNGLQVSRIARYNGGLWYAMGAGVSSDVTALAVNGSDLYVGGRFFQAGGADASRIAKWDGTDWSPLGSGVDGEVLTMAVDPAQSIFVAGNFGVAGTASSPFLAQAIIAERPEIVVEQPADTNLTSGASRDFGLVPVGDSASLSFVIKNTGSLDLTGIAAMISGSHPDDFDTTTSPAASVPPGESTQFTVAFSPSAKGSRSASLQISSNDGDENPFVIQLAGTGAKPELVVEEPEGTILEDGEDRDFGNTPVGDAENLTFTLTNSGDAPLTSIVAAKTGTNGPDISITTPPATSLAPGNTTTFTVAFSPYMRGTQSAGIQITSNADPFSVNLSGTGTAPDVVLEQPAGDILDNGDSRGFGMVDMGSSSSLTFTIRNSGNAPLSDLVFTLQGTHKDDWTLLATPTTAIPPGESATFQATFSPKGVGMRTAELSIASEDIDDMPFSVQLSGSGVPSAVRLSSSKYQVTHGATEVIVTVLRTDGTVPANVMISTQDGTASKIPPFVAALAGTDYVSLTGAAKTVSFAADETEKTVSITLTPVALKKNRRFTVSLSEPDGNALLGDLASATVEILAPDTTRPTLTLTAPAGGAKPVNESKIAPYQIRGTAGDANGIDRVEISLNGASPIAATLGEAKAPTAVPFLLPVMPLPGLNELVITAYDLQGNSTSITRKFNFTRRYQLTVTRDVPTSSPDASGTVSLTASPASAASTLFPAGANKNPQMSHVVPGTALKITATAKAGFVFDRWLNLPQNASVVGNMVSFQMPGADLEDLTAVFVASPFNPPQNRQNTFLGLLQPDESTASTNDTEGFITGTLTTTGAFTGKLFIGGITQPITATFFGNGVSSFKAGKENTTSLTFSGRTLTFAFDSQNQTIQATLTKDTDTSTGSLTRPAYSTKNKVPVELMGSSSAAKALYTMHFPASSQESGIPASAYPQGHGYASIFLSNSGIVSITGVLADGIPVTASSAILDGAMIPFFAQMPTPGAPTKKGGALSGEVVMDFTPADTDLTGMFRWFRSPALGTIIFPYREGWVQGLDLNGFGAFYNSATKISTGLGFDTSEPGPNCQLQFRDGKLSQDLDLTNIRINGNTVTKIPTRDGSFTLTVNASTGLFSGTFTPNWSGPAAAKPAFKGILLQKGAAKGGYGFFISNAKGDPAPESGSVLLKSK